MGVRQLSFSKKLSVVWNETDEPLVVANKFFLRHTGELFELIVGHVAVPFALGADADENEDEDETSLTVGVHPRGLFAVSGENLKDLHQIIEAALKDKGILP